MSAIHAAKSALLYARRRAAIGLFKLARCILRGTISLYKRRLISRMALQVALSATKLLEQAAAALMFGMRRHHKDRDPGRECRP